MALSETQLDAYDRNGYILVSGLIPDDIARAAAQMLWHCMEANPEDPETWPDGNYVEGQDQPEIVACFTQDYLDAVSQLSGDPIDTIHTPRRATALNILPSEGDWQNPRPHIDHAIKDHGHKTFPRPFRVAAMTFLSDVETRGGGTAVWPGSHKKIEALARSDESHYEYMWVLNQALDQVELGEPLLTTPRQGDVLFYDYLCAHAGSKNMNNQPRLAWNYKW